MSAFKFFGITTLSLFVIVGAVGVVKKKKEAKIAQENFSYQEGLKKEFSSQETTSLNLGKEIPIPKEPLLDYITAPITYETEVIEESKEQEILSEHEQDSEVDRIHKLFSKGPTKFPFMETVTYKSRVPWLQGRPAWIADYASYYQTSRHFIARSLNGKKDYFTQKVGSGDQFNVFQKESDIRFHLVVDLYKLKMWFYVYDANSNFRYLLKTYKVGCGKVDKDSASGSLTPLGTFTLSDKVAIYKPGVEGYFKDQKVEMIQIFGTRWMPYTAEQDETAAMIKGFGMHGVPWFRNEVTGELVEDTQTIGKYDSSGCIRLLQEDVEEIFSIVITKPTSVHIVKSFQEAKLPGVEWVDHSDSALN
jgi:hypothetical protein